MLASMNTQTALTPHHNPTLTTGTLRGHFVTLEPLNSDHAAANGKIRYAVHDNRTGFIVGACSLVNRKPAQREVEIGQICLAPSVVGSPLNNEAKLLLLEAAFKGGFTTVVYQPDQRKTADTRRLGVEETTQTHKATVPGVGSRDTILNQIDTNNWPAVETELRSRLAHGVLHSIKATVTQLWLYPIKSLDGCLVTDATIGPAGGLTFDRCWQIVDEEKTPISAKNTPKLQIIRATWSLPTEQRQLGFDLHVPGNDTIDKITGTLPRDQARLEAWFNKLLGKPVTLEYDQRGFPDDREAAGPTIISEETLGLFAQEFKALLGEALLAAVHANLIRRLRPNIVVAGTIEKAGVPRAAPALWEDALYTGTPGAVVPFSIGAVRIAGNNPCTRCAVPARDPESGGTTKGFARLLSEIRERTLPAWAARQRFPQGGAKYYRLAVNTVIGAQSFGKTIRNGDPVRWAL